MTKIIKDLLVAHNIALNIKPIFNDEDSYIEFYEALLFAKFRLLIDTYEIKIIDRDKAQNQKFIKYAIGGKKKQIKKILKEHLKNFISLLAPAKTICFRSLPKITKQDDYYIVSYSMCVDESKNIII